MIFVLYFTSIYSNSSVVETGGFLLIFFFFFSLSVKILENNALRPVSYLPTDTVLNVPSHTILQVFMDNCNRFGTWNFFFLTM